MLEQLDVQPGHWILEIGAGTGYNAALLSHLTGPPERPIGTVTTIDLDQDIVDGARQVLTASGHGNVRVICGDGELGEPDHAPYDRIIVTVSAWDLPPTWLDQLAPNGRLVVPLHIHNSTTRSIAFDRTDTHLASRSMYLCGFVPMRGIGRHTEPRIALNDNRDIQLLLRDKPDHDTAARLSTAPHSTTIRIVDRSDDPPRRTVPTTGPLAGTHHPGFCRLIAQPEAINDGRVTPAFQWGDAAVYNTDSLAYLRLRT